MVCIYCGNDTKVTNSRLQKRSNQVWRRRQCTVCKAVFTTHESVELAQTLSVDSNNAISPFLSDRLYSDVLAALKDHRDSYTAAREITTTIIQKLLRNAENASFSPYSISSATAEVLKRFDRQAWLRYVAEHSSLQ